MSRCKIFSTFANRKLFRFLDGTEIKLFYCFEVDSLEMTELKKTTMKHTDSKWSTFEIKKHMLEWNIHGVWIGNSLHMSIGGDNLEWPKS